MKYLEQVTEDVKSYIREHEIDVNEENRDEIEERLNDELFTEDSVTGNGSGSYTFCSWQAKENVMEDGEDYIRGMISDWGLEPETIAEHLFDWEYWDVSIRCYILSEAIALALDEITGND